MDRDEVRRLLESVAAGGASVEGALQLLASPTVMGKGYDDLGFARVDSHRGLRTGDPEVVYGAGKTPEQAIAIVRSLTRDTARPALVTRAPADMLAAIKTEFPQHTLDEEARAIAVGTLPETRGTVCVVAAGTSDGPVAAEAAFVARVCGAEVTRVTDVGVAGIHRLLSARAELEQADVLIVVAGMDGALPSAVGGLVGTPIVAVPTSVGYGASFGGVAALLAMLNSCAPGVVVSNIDNGFGAAIFAARIARRVGKPK
ncbi:MAG: nickel pincer cofactor biosynthesis protein LarB [Actinomycetota bacterium]